MIKIKKKKKSVVTRGFDLTIVLSKSSLKKTKSKEEGKYQESIQSSTTPGPGHHIGK